MRERNCILIQNQPKQTSFGRIKKNKKVMMSTTALALITIGTIAAPTLSVSADDVTTQKESSTLPNINQVKFSTDFTSLPSQSLALTKQAQTAFSNAKMTKLNSNVAKPSINKGPVKQSIDKTSTAAIDEEAQKVIQGQFGVGSDRQVKVTADGYDYNKVQERVNQIILGVPASVGQESTQVSSQVSQSTSPTSLSTQNTTGTSTSQAIKSSDLVSTSPLNQANYNAYVGGGCTDFVWQYFAKRGIYIGNIQPGNGGDWGTIGVQEGFMKRVALQPGVIASGFSAGFVGYANSPYGHVAVVTAVHSDGTFDVIEGGYGAGGYGWGHTRTNLSPVGVNFVYPS